MTTTRAGILLWTTVASFFALSLFFLGRAAGAEPATLPDARPNRAVDATLALLLDTAQHRSEAIAARPVTHLVASDPLDE